MSKLIRITTYLGSEQVGQAIYLSDSENDQNWLKHFKSGGSKLKRVFETFELIDTEEILPV